MSTQTTIIIFSGIILLNCHNDSYGLFLGFGATVVGVVLGILEMWK